jgi:hypothetical protein
METVLIQHILCYDRYGVSYDETWSRVVWRVCQERLALHVPTMDHPFISVYLYSLEQLTP